MVEPLAAKTTEPEVIPEGFEGDPMNWTEGTLIENPEAIFDPPTPQLSFLVDITL